MTRRKTDAEKYLSAIQRGRQVACKKMHRLADIMLVQIKEGYGRWHYDPEAAERPVTFIETYCYVPSGKKLRTPFKLEPYEKAAINLAFGFVDDDGYRRFTEVFLVWARKNGKSSLLAALALYMLLADYEVAPQVYSVANSTDQASICYNAAVRILRQSKKLKKMLTKQANQIYCGRNMGFYRPLSSQTDNQDGLDVHFGVIDEMGAMTNRDSYDLAKQGTSSREQPMIFTITTNGFVRNNIFDDQYAAAVKWLDDPSVDDRFLPMIYELDDAAEWDDEDCWMKANPGLGTVKKLDALQQNVAKAKYDPSYRPTVMTKDFNMPENKASAWLDYSEAVNTETFDIRSMGFRYGIVGFDASDTIDLSSAQMMLMRPGDDRIYETSMYWIPEETILADSDSGRRRERDDMPYQQWISRGLMRAVPGNKIDKRVFLHWMQELREMGIYTFAIGYDPWHLQEDAIRCEFEAFAGKERCHVVRFGAMTLSQPMKQIRVDYNANRIVDNHNPVNEWCRMNVSIKTDVNSNIQPYKKDLSPSNRIDGFAAEICAYVALMRMWDEYQGMI